MSADQAKTFADRAHKTARETFEKGSAAAEDAARSAEQGYTAAEGMRDFNVRLIEMAYANTVAALDLARDIATVKGPSEATALWSSHAQKQFERLTEQSRELTALAQKIATSSAEPIARGFGQAMHRSG
jgi:phasin